MAKPVEVYADQKDAIIALMERSRTAERKEALCRQPVKWKRNWRELIAIIPCLEKNSHYSQVNFELVEMTEAACTAKGGALGGTLLGMSRW